MMHSKSLIFQTAGFVGGFYYLAKSAYFGDNQVGGKFPYIKSKLVHAKVDFDSSTAFNLKETAKNHEEKGLLWDNNWDKRATEKSANHGVRRTLLFIRHGDYHKEGAMKGSLNEKGIEQATWAGVRLKELVENGQHIDRIIVSTMPRAKESFDAIKSVLNTDDIAVETSDFIREGYPCVPEPMSSTKRPEFVVFQDSAKFEAGFRKVFYRPSSDQEENSFEIYICHANLIRYFVMRALQLPKEAWLRFNLGNASFTEVRVYRDGKVCLNSFGERAHVKC